MNITIDDLNGNTVDVELRHVGAVYEDNDVIYFGSAPFRLSSARPAIRLTPLGADADNPHAECPVCGQPTGWINAPRRSG